MIRWFYGDNFKRLPDNTDGLPAEEIKSKLEHWPETLDGLDHPNRLKYTIPVGAESDLREEVVQTYMDGSRACKFLMLHHYL